MGRRAGMAADLRVLEQAKRTGMGALTPVQGLGALAGILSAPSSGLQPQSHFAILSVDWAIVLKKVRCRSPAEEARTCMLRRAVPYDLQHTRRPDPDPAPGSST